VISLRRLGVDDAGLLHSMLQANAAHLTQRGDFADEVALSLGEVRARLTDNIVRFVIEDDAEPVGHVALVPVDPPHWTIGYWVAGGHVGRGVCTAAVRLALDEARTFGAIDVYAGVTHGNEPSMAVLRKLRFEVVADLDTYTRFWLAL
jgi:RimJ/RimL family protein N-acetyltransferase